MNYHVVVCNKILFFITYVLQMTSLFPKVILNPWSKSFNALACSTMFQVLPQIWTRVSYSLELIEATIKGHLIQILGYKEGSLL
jgi:hypothetical protein